MRILEINKFFYLRRGAERHMLDVMEALRKKGHEVEVFSMQHSENLPTQFQKYFVSYVGYNAEDSGVWQKIKGISRLFWSFEAKRNIESLLSEWRPDVVHLHNIYHQLSPSILGPLRKYGIPIVMTVHDYNLISPDKDQYYSEVGKHYWKFLFIKKYSLFKRILLIKKMYWNRFLRFYERNIDLYITPSQFVKDVLVRAGMPEGKIVVLSHFISSRSFSRDSSSSVPSVSLPHTPFALYFGSISKEKGVNDLIKVFEKLHIPLVLAGTLESGYTLPESSVMTYIGKQSKEALESIMEQSSVVVSASTLPETFGLIALESIALAKPFFGLKSGALPEIIHDGKNGFLASDTAELQTLLQKFFSGEITFDSQAIQKEAREKFGEEKYISELEKIFLKLKNLHRD